MNTKAYIEAFYDAYDEDGRLASRHGAVEFAVTMTYIERYAKPGMRILEIGAGTGRYSHTLARRGFCVDAVELAEHNIELFRRNTAAGEPVTIRQGDARDLSAFADETYDVTLLLGPMSSVHARRPVGGAVRRPSASAWQRRFGLLHARRDILQYGFVREYPSLHRAGCLTPRLETHSEPKDVFELYRREDIDLLRGALPVTQLRLSRRTASRTIYARPSARWTRDVCRLARCYAHLRTAGYGQLPHHTIDIFRKTHRSVEHGTQGHKELRTERLLCASPGGRAMYDNWACDAQ
ncbi:MAG: class I SAM-dependent methyltransferase [Acutalibacteraceae bacterium]